MIDLGFGVCRINGLKVVMSLDRFNLGLKVVIDRLICNLQLSMGGILVQV